MIVHFIAAKSNIQQDYPSFMAIIDTVRELGHEIARDWVNPEYQLVRQGKSHDSINWQAVNQENMTALSLCDMVIAEASSRSFSTGFQVRDAIQQKKPVLILTKDKEMEGSFASGIDSDFVQIRSYTSASLRSVIETFIEENDTSGKDRRLNMFLDRRTYNYLGRTAAKKQKNKSEIIRDLLLREMREEERRRPSDDRH